MKSTHVSTYDDNDSFSLKREPINLHLHLYCREKTLRPADKWQLGLDLSGRETTGEMGGGKEPEGTTPSGGPLPSAPKNLPDRNTDPMSTDFSVFQKNPEFRIYACEICPVLNVSWEKKLFFWRPDKCIWAGFSQ